MKLRFLNRGRTVAVRPPASPFGDRPASSMPNLPRLYTIISRAAASCRPYSGLYTTPVTTGCCPRGCRPRLPDSACLPEHGCPGRGSGASVDFILPVNGKVRHVGSDIGQPTSPRGEQMRHGAEIRSRVHRDAESGVCSTGGDPADSIPRVRGGRISKPSGPAVSTRTAPRRRGRPPRTRDGSAGSRWSMRGHSRVKPPRGGHGCPWGTWRSATGTRLPAPGGHSASPDRDPLRLRAPAPRARDAGTARSRRPPREACRATGRGAPAGRPHGRASPIVP